MTGSPGGVNTLVGRDGEHIGHPAVLEHATQSPDLAVGLVTGDPPGGDAGIEGAGEHALRELGLGREPDLLANPGLGAAHAVGGPGLSLDAPE